MKIALVAGILFCSATASADVVGPMAGFHGFRETNATLIERVKNEGFVLGSYLDVKTENPLLDLAGFYRSNGLTTGFQNGQPNGVNMLLWYLTFSGLSDDFGKICEDSSSFRTDLIEAVKPLCTWPSAESRIEQNLEAFWLQVMRYDAPVDEFQTWRDFFLGPQYQKSTHQEVLKAMSFAILMNPYFLLRK